MAYRYGCKNCKCVAEHETENESPVCTKCRKRGLFVIMKRITSLEELGNAGMCSHCGKFCSSSGVYVDGKFYGPTCAKRYGG